MQRNLTILTCAGIVSVFIHGLPASAQTMCSKPVQPLCTTDLQAVDTGPERLRCLEDTARYSDGLGDYRDCLDTTLARAEAMIEVLSQFRDCLRADRENCRVEDTD
mgnify:CR=1 FL=1